MANPQPDKFTRISNELYEAIMQTDFTKRQRNILDLVIRMSYGCGKKFAILRPSDFEVVGIYKTHIKKELEYLVKVKVLEIDGDKITLNKNYDEWRVNIVKQFDQERFNDILKRNLINSGDETVTKTVTDEKDQVTKTVTQVTEMVTEVTKTVTDDGVGSYQNSNFETRNSYQNSNQSYQNSNSISQTGYQNSNSLVTKIVTETSRETSNDAGFEPPKEINKKNINTVVEEEKDPFNLLGSKYVQRRGKGFALSPIDCQSINRVLNVGVDVDDALKWIDECFDSYKPKYPGDSIQSFTYVEKFIMDRHHRKQAFEKNRREANAAYRQRNRGDPGTGEEDIAASGYFTSIPGLIRTV